MQTPLESFIDYKADTGSQCGNHSIDVPELKKGEQYRFHFNANLIGRFFSSVFRRLDVSVWF